MDDAVDALGYHFVRGTLGGLWRPSVHPVSGGGTAAVASIAPEYVQAFKGNNLMAAVPADPSVADWTISPHLPQWTTVFAIDTSTFTVADESVSVTCLVQGATTGLTSAIVAALPTVVSCDVFEARNLPKGVAECHGWDLAFRLICTSATYTTGGTIAVVVDSYRGFYEEWNLTRLTKTGPIPGRVTLLYAHRDAHGTYVNRLLHAADRGAKRQKERIEGGRDDRPLQEAPGGAPYTHYRPWRSDTEKAIRQWNILARR